MTTPHAPAEQLFYEALRVMGEGDFVAAENGFRQALQLAPALSEAHANLGYLLDSQGRNQEAEACYRQALALAPMQLQTYINLGALLESQQRFAEAEVAYQSALAIDPESPAAWSNLGVLMTCMKREAEAEPCFRKALELAPDYQKASFNLAHLLLRQGRYEEGWRHMESRDWYAQIAKHLGMPRWQGETLAGEAILIGLEAGHGDMIQFCRYGNRLKELGARRVSVLCHPPLKSLFQHLAGIDEAIAVGEPDPGIAWDFWTPPLSQPYYLGTRLDTIPAELPYLQVAPDKVADWQAVMGDGGDALRVGLVWKGNPRFENDAYRSLRSLHDLAPLGEVAGIRYFSLQKGAGEDETASAVAPFAITPLGADIADFSDTAAIMMNLDLVIAVDTAAAHLAGALGRRCWVLLPDYKTDWRWLAERSDSPWYPGVMRLFRQDATGTWAPVIAQLKDALADLVKQRGQAIASAP
ncbi:tetratricopeptide repeat protein [Dechloromonas sp.]|uniref:tetratricopeptide repeat protein n=1 Tax=Dechloromonas sp. TaxID=1917218 RepID=UPI00286E0DFA|nr:tetratricopeptide repeat protein [Dechloromonas sp.]